MNDALELNEDAKQFVVSLSESLLERSARLSPVALAQYAGLAFERAFGGTRKEARLANAIARGLSVREKMAAEEGGSLSAEEAARLLGITKQSVLNMFHAGKLLGWRIEKQGAIRFPAWQFHEGRRLPGLETILTTLNEAQVLDEWGKIGFFLQTHGGLGDRRPLDLLRKGEVAQVLRAAEAYVE
jgi:hypothetical protein